MGLNNLIARETSPHSQHENSRERTSPQHKERYAWRLNTLWRDGPNARFRSRPSPTTIAEQSSRGTTPDHERTFALAVDRSGSALSTKSDQTSLHSTSKLGGQELSLLGRRRKASVPELGPMTTVQEVSLDSHEATIPGRPPLHERSSSAPTWSNLPENNTEIAQISPLHIRPQQRRFPVLARTLTPLVIPAGGRQIRTHIRTRSVDSEDVPPEVPPKSARFEGQSSPMQRGLESSMSTWSGATPSTSYTGTPPSATGTGESSKPWINTPAGNSPVEARRRPSETFISNRGRAVMRSDSTLKHQASTPNKKSPSAEERAFQMLPVGFRPAEAVMRLPKTEIEDLQRQAISQISQYAVLCAKDVEALSKELRALDERCEYLRKTHTSLRAGRRSLHARMVGYLKSPRVAVFSRESLLKQEEALAELDLSIDDWVLRLDKAENRRTRVRQKLLEHLAAASTLDINQKTEWRQTQEQTPPRSPEKADIQPRNERKDVESIKIYADADVHALLADVEQEIGDMVRTCLDYDFNSNNMI